MADEDAVEKYFTDWCFIILQQQKLEGLAVVMHRASHNGLSHDTENRFLCIYNWPLNWFSVPAFENLPAAFHMNQHYWKIYGKC